MAMTLATLRSLTRQLIGDPQGSTYSPEMYQDAINFACKEYAKKTGVTYEETSTLLDMATGLCTIPTSYLRINRVMCDLVTIGFSVYNALTDPVLVQEQSFGYQFGPYNAYVSCYPKSTTLVLKSGIVTIYNHNGGIVTTRSVNDQFNLIAASDPLNNTAIPTLTWFEIVPAWVLSAGQYVDFVVIASFGSKTKEINMRYAVPLVG